MLYDMWWQHINGVMDTNMFQIGSWIVPLNCVRVIQVVTLHQAWCKLNLVRKESFGKPV